MRWAPTGGQQAGGREVGATREQPEGVSCRGASPSVPPAVLQGRSAEVQSAPLAVLPCKALGSPALQPGKATLWGLDMAEQRDSSGPGEAQSRSSSSLDGV